MELYKKYRPRTFKQIVGQDSSVQVLKAYLKRKNVPHTLLFTGPSGCGKTTLARIMASKLKCSGEMDLEELNCADFRGIPLVRDIRARINLKSLGGESRVWIIDEAHRLTGDAQDAFLKMLEDTPRHVYFMLCTTDPQKLKATVRNRATVIPVKLLLPEKIENIVNDVAEKEGIELSEDVVEVIAEHSEGSPRAALVMLDQISAIEEEEERLEIIRSSAIKEQAESIAKALMNPKSKWPQVAAILRNIEDDPEKIRHAVLGYASAVLLKAGGKIADLAYLIITCFEDPFYESKKAGLVKACYEAMSTRKK